MKIITGKVKIILILVNIINLINSIIMIIEGNNIALIITKKININKY